jgi:peptide/nickel transport system permease protein
MSGMDDVPGAGPEAGASAAVPSGTASAGAAASSGTGPGRGPRRRRGHPLARFLIRRILIAVLLAWGITLVTFVLTNMVPGDPVAANLGQQALSDPAIVAQWRSDHGLDKPLWEQYVLHLEGLLHGDLGTSQQSHRPVAQDLAESVPATLELAGAAILVSLVLGVAFGVIAALRRDRLPDHALRVLSLIGISVPTFWLALVAFYVFFYRLQITPGSGRVDAALGSAPPVTGLQTVDALLAGRWDIFTSAVGHLVTPALVLALYTIGLLTRFTRSAVLEVLGQDYVRAARAKGLPGRVVLFRYVLRSALVPIITVAGLAFGSLLSGTVLVEAIFAWPGVGQYAYKSATTLDLPAVMGVGLVVGIVYLVINLVVDVLYGVIDPRVRLQ